MEPKIGNRLPGSPAGTERRPVDRPTAGYIRLYSRILGLPAEEVARALKVQLPREPDEALREAA